MKVYAILNYSCFLLQVLVKVLPVLIFLEVLVLVLTEL